MSNQIDHLSQFDRSLSFGRVLRIGQPQPGECGVLLLISSGREARQYTTKNKRNKNCLQITQILQSTTV